MPVVLSPRRKKESSAIVSDSSADRLVDLGFNRDLAIAALLEFNNDFERALDYLLSTNVLINIIFTLTMI